MVITVLTATVAAERVGDLERAYREGTAGLAPEVRQTFLVRDTTERDTFLIVTHWVSREALDQMRASGVTPRGVQIFQAAGVTPELSVLDVIVHRDGVSAGR
jgi:heme-degrading monooxygenase HmoA